MKRPYFALLVLLSAAANQGCQSCCAPHDYSSPVADCQCNGCTNYGHGRAGSVITGSRALTAEHAYIEGEEVVETQVPPTPPKPTNDSAAPR